MSKAINWIDEKVAAEKVRRKPRTLRELVKSGKWQVAYSAINNRRFQYNEKDIDRLLLENSTAL